jgi:hypothetical protein
LTDRLRNNPVKIILKLPVLRAVQTRANSAAIHHHDRKIQHDGGKTDHGLQCDPVSDYEVAARRPPRPLGQENRDFFDAIFSKYSLNVLKLQSEPLGLLRGRPLDPLRYSVDSITIDERHESTAGVSVDAEDAIHRWADPPFWRTVRCMARTSASM